MMDDWWDGAWGWWMGMMGVGMLLILLVFLALLVGGVYLIARAVRGDDRRRSADLARIGQRSNALSILEERYARGEIDREEFEQRRRDLSG